VRVAVQGNPQFQRVHSIAGFTTAGLTFNGRV
jgi:hypothetical protein